jgi:hypothetical protein
LVLGRLVQRSGTSVNLIGNVSIQLFKAILQREFLAVSQVEWPAALRLDITHHNNHKTVTGVEYLFNWRDGHYITAFATLMRRKVTAFD